MGNKQGLLKTEDWWSVWLGLFIFMVHPTKAYFDS